MNTYLLAHALFLALAAMALTNCATFGGKGTDKAAAIDPRAVVQTAGLNRVTGLKQGDAPLGYFGLIA